VAGLVIHKKITSGFTYFPALAAMFRKGGVGPDKPSRACMVKIHIANAGKSATIMGFPDPQRPRAA